MWAHDFLDHQRKYKAYFCPECEHVDVVTKRFEQHLWLMHGCQPADIEAVFRDCPGFTKLKPCVWPNCIFLTMNDKHLHDHLRKHSPDRRDAAEEDRSREVFDTGNVGHSEVNPRDNQLPEPCHGQKPTTAVRPSPTEQNAPMSPQVEVVDDNSSDDDSTRGPRRSQEMTVDMWRRFDRAITAGQAVRAVDPPTPQPVRTPRRPTVTDLQRILDDTRIRSNEGRRHQELFDVVAQIVLPELLVTPRRTQLEAMAKRKAKFRYIAELNYAPGRMQYVYMYVLPAIITQGAIVRQTAGNPHMATIRQLCTCLHDGDPAKQSSMQGCLVPWRVRGPVYDTRSKPWTIVQVMVLSRTAEEGTSYVVDAARRSLIHAEVVGSRV